MYSNKKMLYLFKYFTFRNFKCYLVTVGTIRLSKTNVLNNRIQTQFKLNKISSLGFAFNFNEKMNMISFTPFSLSFTARTKHYACY